MNINKETGMKALYGGLLLGGGGGGSLSGGIEILEELLKLREIKLYDIDEISEDTFVVTASLVGSPSSKDKFVNTYHYKNIYDTFTKIYDKKIEGIITNEIGAQSITNGWIISALTGIPFIDAPCNGRAHPTGAMGSMGLSKIKEFVSFQVCAGGKNENEIQLAVSSTLEKSSDTVRNAAVLAGGFVTVLRNPVPAAYVKSNAATGGVSFAIELGDIIYKNKGNLYKIIGGLQELTNIQVICEGTISDLSLATKGGFDVGDFCINSEKGKYDITFWNEYITIEKGNERLASFPDLIAVFDKETALPLTSAEIKNNQRVLLSKISKERLILGGGMFDRELFKHAEKIINKNLTNYVFGR